MEVLLEHAVGITLAILFALLFAAMFVGLTLSSDLDDRDEHADHLGADAGTHSHREPRQ